jgi:methylated-DNA-protein-cysteine methyltransferase related protein
MVDSSYQRIYAVIRRIPKGRVATYGQIAQMAGLPRQARQVGYALSALPEGQDVPWHRVINAKGEISFRAEPHFGDIQRSRLEKEGVVFNGKNQTSLVRFQWKPKGSF